MHGFTQGVITGVSGGDFYQGFWAAAVSSVVSSAVPALGNQVNFIAKNETMSTLLFGTVSGGVSAELADGNFWQGAATGLVVSWLNHTLHKMSIKEIKSRMYQEFEDAYGTTKSLSDPPPATVEEVQNLTNDLPTLNDLVNNKLSGKNIGLDLRPNTIGRSAKGPIQSRFAQGTLILFKGAFRSYSDLISTLYHEYNHAYNMVFLRRNWPANLKLRDNIDEYLAYKAEYGYTSNAFAESQMNYYKELIPSNYH